MKYRDLPLASNGTFLVCLNITCIQSGEHYSSTRGDYFMADPNAEVKCGACEKPLSFAREERRLVLLNR